MIDEELLSWGRYPRVEQRAVRLLHRDAALPAFDGSALPRGNGRSYGDSCLASQGPLLDARGLDRFIAFDRSSGRIACEAGVLLADIIALAMPQGWFLPVTPGTRFVTVGGALANDVHGKNHHRAGSFGNHVLRFELLRSDGTRRIVAPDDDEGWFAATVGGLGLTGVVTWVEMQLRPVAGPWITTVTERFGRLPDFFALSDALEADHEYTVAWVDCGATGARSGRGVFYAGDHAPALARPGRGPSRARLSVPFAPPISPLNTATLRLFNAAYWRVAPSRRRHSTQHYVPFFYPLDAVGRWNRGYGRAGFLQHQCVVPRAAREDAIAELLRIISASGEGSFLVVLKNFGTMPSRGIMSFPRAGTTLALDFPYRGPSTLALLERLDQVVLEAGGALYPGKDARMSPTVFRHSFPQWERFSRSVDPRFESRFWRRVAAP